MHAVCYNIIPHSGKDRNVIPILQVRFMRFYFSLRNEQMFYAHNTF